MPIQRLKLVAQEKHRGLRLDQVLADWLPEALGRPLSKAKVRKLIVAGGVYLNRKRVRIASKPVLPGAAIEAFIDPARLDDTEGPSRDQPFVLEASRILFEDEWLIAVDKPPGLPTQPTLDEARDNLFAALKRFLANRDRTVDPYVGLHHRLDRDTSGVMLFTKSVKANAGVARLFSEHLARKTYHALTVRGTAETRQQWTVRNFLGKAPGGGKRARFTAVRSGGDAAHTDFRLLERLDHGLWIEAQPLTGRTHQIRVHLAESGLPILGDPHYGGPTSVAGQAIPRVMLHAAALTFPHPITSVECLIEARIPTDFNRCLQQLKQP